MAWLSAAVLLTGLLSGCSSSADLSGLLSERNTGVSLFSGKSGTPYTAAAADEYEDICSSGRYTLRFRQDIAAVSLFDNQTGSAAWNGAVTEELYPELAMSTKVWADYMQSLAAITTVSKSDTRGNFVKEYSASDDNQIDVLRFDNGLSVTITFHDSNIRLCVEIAMDEQGLRLRIPSDKIEENGDYYLYAVELLPFFGAANKQEDGYLFYPDGSGALSYFNQTDSKHLYATALTLDIYGPILQTDLFSDTANPTTPLPVYGVKKQDRAFLAAITEGAEYAQIGVNPSVNMSTIKLNRCSFNFIYREQYRIYLSNIVKYGDNLSSTLYGTRMAADRLDLDREVRLFFLEDDEADYSGMANVYRSYLLRSKQMNTVAAAAEPPLSLMLFMGTQSDSGLIKSLVEMTSFEDAERILSGYLEADIPNLQVLLRGWTEHGYGYTPDKAVPASALGGKKGLESLDRFAAAHPGLSISLELDPVYAVKDKGHFSVGKDVLLQGNGSPVSDLTESFFYLSPARVWSNLQRNRKSLASYGNLHIAYETLGSRLLQDMRDKAAVSRVDTRDVWQQILASDKAPVVEGGNLYALAHAVSLYDIPMTSSLNQITDVSVPWYSMVVYGSIPFTSEPGNLSYDLNRTKLEWLETGCLPTFELSQNSPTLLQNTDYTRLFTCENEDWKERVTAVYKEFRTSVWPHTTDESAPVYMVKHTYLESGFVKTLYSNGTALYINYTESPKTADGYTVGAGDYLVVGKEGVAP